MAIVIYAPVFIRPRPTKVSESGTETDKPHHQDTAPPRRTESSWTYSVDQHQDGTSMTHKVPQTINRFA